MCPVEIPEPIKRALTEGVIVAAPDGSIWRVKRRYKSRLYALTPHKIDHKTKIGGHRVTIREGVNIFNARVKLIHEWLRANPQPHKLETFCGT